MTTRWGSNALDGNVLAGPLGAVLGGDVTSILATCAGCGTSGVVARLVVYVGGPGMVGRCPGCGGVVLRLATDGVRTWLDLSGCAVVLVDGAGFAADATLVAGAGPDPQVRAST